MGPRETIRANGNVPTECKKIKYETFLGFEGTIVCEYSTKLSTSSIIVSLKDSVLNFMIDCKAIFFLIEA